MKRIAALLAGLALSFSSFAACTAVSAISIDGNGIDASTMIAFLNNPCLPALTVTGPLNASAGVQPVGTAAAGPLSVANYPMGSVALASIGTNTADVAGQLWVTGVWVPASKTITKINYLSGGTATTDNFLVAIYDANGKLLGSSAAAGVLVATANIFQSISLTASTTLSGPGLYYVAVQGNGTAAGAIQTLSALYNTVPTTVVSGTFGTVPASITVPTTFTAANGPVIQLQ